MKRLSLLLLLLPATAQGAELRLDVCDLRLSVEAEAADELDRWVATAAVRPAEKCTAPTADRWTGRFVARGGGVSFELASSHARIERRVPWLSSPRDPLSSLRRVDRLSDLSILVESLLAEHRLLRMLEEEVAEAPTEARPPPRKEPPPPRPKVAVQREPPPASVLSPSPGPAASRLPLPDLSELATAPLPAVEKKVPEPAERREEPPPRRRRRPSPPAIELPLESEEPGPPLGLTASAGWVLRSPGFHGPELQARFSLASFYLRGGWMPSTDWDLQGYELRTEVLSLGAGIRWSIVEWAGTSLHAELELLGETLAVEPLYRREGGSHRSWDAGAGGALRWGLGPFPDTRISLLAGAQLLPTAAGRSTHLGVSGPSAPLNAVAARIGVEFGWGG